MVGHLSGAESRSPFKSFSVLIFLSVLGHGSFGKSWCLHKEMCALETHAFEMRIGSSSLVLG